MCLIRGSGFTPVMINAESASLVFFCFLLHPFQEGRDFWSWSSLLLFLLPLVYGTMYGAMLLVDLQMSLGLASRGFLYSARLCHYSSSRRCAPCLRLYSCCQAHHPALIASLHAVPCYMCFKGERLCTDAVCTRGQLLFMLWLLLFPIKCWTSTASFA